MKSEKTVFTNESYNSMTVAELRAEAKKLNLIGYSKISKVELIDLLIFHQPKVEVSKEEVVKAKKETSSAKKETSVAKVETKVAKKEVEILKKEVEEKEDKKQSDFEKKVRAEVSKEDSEKSKVTKPNKNRSAFRDLKEMNSAITKVAFNPDTNYKRLLKEAKKAASKVAALKDKGKGKDKAKGADKGTTQTTKETSPKAPYTRWDAAAEVIKSKKNYKSIDELVEKTNKIYVEKSGKGANLNETKYVVKSALKLLVHFDVVVKIG